jgi:hypothetical protein
MIPSEIMNIADRSHLIIAMGASAGGHTDQLLSLGKHVDLWPASPALYVTTLDILAAKYAATGKRVYVIGECDRRKLSAIPGVIWRSLRCAWIERPHVVVTTGSMPLVVFCLWAKLLGAKIVWIDSVANTDGLSMSGRLARRFADLCLTQWPEVAQHEWGVEYAGQLI